jgi:phage terminase small subunit
MAKPKLTVKEAKLVKGVASGKPKYIAAIDAGYSPKSAPQIADETLKKPNVQEALQAELIRQGISLEQIVAPVTRALVDDSIELQLKGHDRAMKILGANQSQGGNTINNFGTIVNELKAKYE